ncbi:hypothetical protein PIB30_041864, partial [Stylosanthes scabra]|nr:hypothetical protein [Stylosanthes scabra]
MAENGGKHHGTTTTTTTTISFNDRNKVAEATPSSPLTPFPFFSQEYLSLSKIWFLSLFWRTSGNNNDFLSLSPPSMTTTAVYKLIGPPFLRPLLLSHRLCVSLCLNPHPHPSMFGTVTAMAPSA